MDFKDYYDILGLDRTASQDDIKRAYRKLARRFHPDVTEGLDAEEKFKDAGEAYEVLKDPEKRAAYDQLGSNWQAGQEFHRPPNWNQGFEFSGGGFTEADPEAFSEFFETMFGHSGQPGGFRQGFQAMGQDQFAKIQIEIPDAFTGASRDLILQVPEVERTGRVRRVERKIAVHIPKGVSSGQHLRLHGQGAEGIGGGPAGDLMLEVSFKAHPIYRADGLDIYLDLPITPWEAALGERVDMTTPAGLVDIKIPKNAKSGQKLRLKGRGIPGRPVGNLYAILQIVTPPAESDTAREFYERMSQEMNFDPRAKMGAS